MVPAAIPVTDPVVVTSAIALLPVVHVAPATAQVKAEEMPVHIRESPLIVSEPHPYTVTYTVVVSAAPAQSATTTLKVSLPVYPLAGV